LKKGAACVGHIKCLRAGWRTRATINAVPQTMLRGKENAFVLAKVEMPKNAVGEVWVYRVVSGHNTIEARTLLAV
jgi:hypothetical protein